MESRAAAGVSGAAAGHRGRRLLERVTLALILAVGLPAAARGVQAVLDRGGAGNSSPDQLARLERAVKASPGGGDARFSVAMAFEHQGRHSDAVRETRVAPKIQPVPAGAVAGPGRALLAGDIRARRAPRV